MIWLRNKNINFHLHTLIWRPELHNIQQASTPQKDVYSDKLGS